MPRKSSKTSDAKTAAPRRIQTKKIAEKKETKIEESNTAAIETPKGFSDILRKPQVIVLVIAILVIGFAYQFKSLFVAALVNGQPISRITLINELEKQSGKQMLDSLISKALIAQEAKKQNVTVSQKEIDDEVKRIEDTLKKRGQNLDQLLAFQGTTKQGFIEQIKIQKTVQKLIGKDIKVTDKEINDYYEKNKESLPKNAKPEELKTTIKDQMEQQKLSEKFQLWMQDLRNKAKINYFVSY
ncbi:MAG: SurA N-terminal domain-containing protein [Actinobacteria bacterium]|nr:SurA N-terminal domain-containing protein [Actinomycetota bacterium]